MNQMKNFLKSAMQKQKNAIFIHIWWVAPDINSHMSQRHPPAIIRPISQKALLKKMAPTWILVCQIFHFRLKLHVHVFFLCFYHLLQSFYLLHMLSHPPHLSLPYLKNSLKFFFRKKNKQSRKSPKNVQIKYVWDVAIRCTLILCTILLF